MTPYTCKTKDELTCVYEQLQEHFASLKDQKLSLNMARGKPSSEQLDMVSDILTILTDPRDCIADDVDVRNYGEPAGLKSAREYWAEIFGCRVEQVMVGGASSLNLMYDVISRAYSHGLKNSPRPWCQERKVKFLCPCPGYDRHFKITESFGTELIPVPMTHSGPDMDLVEELIKDPAVKGIWCVPKFSNPDGITYSGDTVNRFAQLNPAAPDFTIMWDNAYCIHEFEGEFAPFPEILSLCADAGHPDMVYEFGSTSKITFPGAGVAAMAASVENQKYMARLMSTQLICYDKVNQLRHVRYLKNKEHTLELMKRHAKILAPKFHLVADTLARELTPCGFGSWNAPDGGYFISLNTMNGTAKRALELCKQAGVTMTPAGATFPYGIDPNDSNIRIAPSVPPISELEKAMDVLCTSLKMAAIEKLLQQ